MKLNCYVKRQAKGLAGIAMCMVTLLFVSAGCRQSLKLDKFENKLKERCHYMVIGLEVGKGIVLPINAEDRHEMEFNLYEGAILDDYVCGANLSRWLDYCTGCDSCMRCYANAGLIKYNVKERSESHVKADVELTSKGKKYLLENMKSGVKEDLKSGGGKYNYIKKYEENGVALVVTCYEEVAKVKLLHVLADNINALDGYLSRYICEVEENDCMTPFMTALNGNKKVFKTKTEKYCVEYIESENVGDTWLYYDDEESGLLYRLQHDGYDLKEYGSLKAVLKEHFGLSDSLSTCDELRYSWYPDGRKMYINKDEYLKEGEPLPEWCMQSLYQIGGTPYLVGASFDLKKIIDVHNWHWSKTEKPIKTAGDWASSEAWQCEDWKLKEVVYEIEVVASPYMQRRKDWDEEFTLYGKCPYLQLGDIIYFPSRGLWGKSKSELCKASYIITGEYHEKGIGYPSKEAEGTLKWSAPFKDILSSMK